jgi:transcription initiation factor TFIIIB Brf1 subunit/transcription initiation factor TFIIB
MDKVCKHPKVRVVAREEDVEYVECQDCGEVFDSNEFQDMAIEENGELDPDEAEKKTSASKPIRTKKRAGA